MPERVVDLLEPIEVHDQERETGILAARLQDRLLDAIAEQRPVGQARQRVVKSLILVLFHLKAQLACSPRDEDDLNDVERRQSDHVV